MSCSANNLPFSVAPTTYGKTRERVLAYANASERNNAVSRWGSAQRERHPRASAVLRSLQIGRLFVRERALQRHLGGVLNDKLFAEQDTSLHVARVSGMIAPGRCVWTPPWSENHSRRYGLSEGQVQACLDKRGPG